MVFGKLRTLRKQRRKDLHDYRQLPITATSLELKKSKHHFVDLRILRNTYFGFSCANDLRPTLTYVKVGQSTVIVASLVRV